jgi:hypothetical protein
MKSMATESHWRSGTNRGYLMRHGTKGGICVFVIVFYPRPVEGITQGMEGLGHAKVSEFVV